MPRFKKFLRLIQIRLDISYTLTHTIIVKRFKQYITIRNTILCSLLISWLSVFFGCEPTENYNPYKTPEVQPYEPYDKKIGNGQLTYYIFHNFMGQEPDIIPSTATADTESYLEKGILYLQTQYGSFSENLADRPNLQRYFAQVTFSPEIKNNHHHKREYTVSEKMDYYINQISDSCELVMTDILENLDEPHEREAFILCYRVLANEAYWEGLGKVRESSNKMMEKYKLERASISDLWIKNQFLRSVDLENDIENRKLLNATGKLYTLIHNAVLNMQKNSITEDIKLKDLQNFINLALTESSLKAMHDYTAKLLRHTEEECGIESGIVDAMGK